MAGTGEFLEAIVEEAISTDRAAVVELFAEDLAYLRMDVDPEALGNVFDSMLSDPRAVVLVARQEEGGEAVGVLVASRMLSVKFAGRALWIEELYVGKHARRRGYGRDLVEGLMDLAEDWGIRGIDLEAYHGNDAAALLYRSLGFMRLGRERFSYSFDLDDGGDTDADWGEDVGDETA